MWPFKKKKSLFNQTYFTEDELRIVELLLSGDSEYLELLRRQVTPDFQAYARRIGKDRVYAIRIGYYIEDKYKYSAGPDNMVVIDDLIISRRKVKRSAPYHTGIASLYYLLHPWQ